MQSLIEPFWRTTPLSPVEIELLNAVWCAQALSANRNNASTAALVNAAANSGDFTKAIISALAATGGRHAPIEETFDFIQRGLPFGSYIATNKRIPGWGNSFEKRDRNWLPVEAVLDRANPELSETIRHRTSDLHAIGLDIYPNASCYTAAAALTLGMPRNLAACLFVLPRMAPWTEIFWSSSK